MPRQKDWEFQVHLGYLERSCLKAAKPKKQQNYGFHNLQGQKPDQWFPGLWVEKEMGTSGEPEETLRSTELSYSWL